MSQTIADALPAVDVLTRCRHIVTPALRAAVDR
jgi:hypothetical protein